MGDISPVIVFGVGNTLMGDDGVGQIAVKRLAKNDRFHNSGVVFHHIEGDILEIADWLDRAPHFIFVDALHGEPIGEVLRHDPKPTLAAPSFHQSDIGTTMLQLEAIEAVVPFPEWEIWGVRIVPPTQPQDTLSPIITASLPRLVLQISRRMDEILNSSMSLKNPKEHI